MLSTFLKNKILDKVLRGIDFDVEPVYASLHTANPGLTGTSEVVGNYYARVQVPAALWNASAAGATTTNATIQFIEMPEAAVTYIGLWDALTGGNFLWGDPLAAAFDVEYGDTLELAAGAFDAALIEC